MNIRRVIQIVGGIFIAISVVLMLAFIIVPAVIPSYDSIPPLKALDQALLCKQGETFTEARDTYNPYPGTTVTSITLSCTNSRGQERDVSDGPVKIGGIGYLVFFLLGLFMVMGASQKKRVQRTPSVTVHYNDASYQPHALNQATNDLSADPKAYFQAEQELAKIGQSRPLNQVKRLTELKSALAQGLITQEEYDAKHKEILNEM